MTTSKKDTKKNFSAANNRFLVDLAGVIKVRCLECRSNCACIPLPKFSMYFCENPNCGNNLELRYHDNKTFEIHDYGSSFKEKTFQVALEKLIDEQHLLVPPPPKQPAKVYKFPMDESK